jgi:hypothetical protein
MADGLLMSLTLRGNGDETRGWELPAFKEASGQLQAPQWLPQGPPMAAHGVLGAGQSQLELIRRAAPNGKNQGDQCGTPQWGSQGGVEGSRVIWCKRVTESGLTFPQGPHIVLLHWHSVICTLTNLTGPKTEHLDGQFTQFTHSGICLSFPCQLMPIERQICCCCSFVSPDLDPFWSRWGDEPRGV